MEGNEYAAKAAVMDANRLTSGRPMGYLSPENSPADSAPEEMSAIRREMYRVRGALEGCGIRAAQLVERIQPVLYQGPQPADNRAVAQEPEPSSPLAMELRKFHNDLVQISESLEAAGFRVQL